MEMLLFTVVAIALYFVSDWILLRVEAARGKPFEHRTLVFFAIILVLALASFALIRGTTDGARASHGASLSDAAKSHLT